MDKGIVSIQGIEGHMWRSLDYLETLRFKEVADFIIIVNVVNFHIKNV